MSQSPAERAQAFFDSVPDPTEPIDEVLETALREAQAEKEREWVRRGGDLERPK